MKGPCRTRNGAHRCRRQGRRARREGSCTGGDVSNKAKKHVGSEAALFSVRRNETGHVDGEIGRFGVRGKRKGPVGSGIARVSFDGKEKGHINSGILGVGPTSRPLVAIQARGLWQKLTYRSRPTLGRIGLISLFP